MNNISNQLGLNGYFLNHIETLRRDYIWRYLQGKYIDAVDTLEIILAELPPSIKDDEVRSWQSEIAVIQRKAVEQATGNSKTSKMYNQHKIRMALCKQFIRRVNEPLHEKLHKAGIFNIPANSSMVYPAEMPKSQAYRSPLLQSS